jgi:hypothetical protein
MGFQPSKVWVNQCDGHFSTTFFFCHFDGDILASPAPAKHTCVVFACQSLAMTTPLVLKELVERAHDQNIPKQNMISQIRGCVVSVISIDELLYVPGY